MKRDLVNEACPHCGKPVYADQGYHSVARSHYDCENKQAEKLEEAKKRLDGLFAEWGLKPKRHKKREGEGAIAQKLIKLATEAFERETGVTVVSARIWNQQGQYRGKHWDLARWGVDFTFHTKHGTTARGSIHSWSTMTQCAKQKTLALHQEDMPYTFSA